MVVAIQVWCSCRPYRVFQIQMIFLRCLVEGVPPNGFCLSWAYFEARYGGFDDRFRVIESIYNRFYLTVKVLDYTTTYLIGLMDGTDQNTMFPLYYMVLKVV